MNRDSQGSSGCCGITRRGFLSGVGAGLALGGPLGWLAYQGNQEWKNLWQRSAGSNLPTSAAEFGMPGRYPGSVVEVRHEGSVDTRYRINADAVGAMMRRGMCELTGADDPAQAWRTLFARDDIVGIKVNPVGRSRDRGEIASISSPQVLLETVRALKNEVGMRPQNIIVFERYADEFIDSGYLDLMFERDMAGVRWYASSSSGDGQQVALDGQISGSRHPNVVGYDRDAFVTMGFAGPDHDPKDDRRFRSHLSLIVSRMVNKIITIPVLKDHRSAGVTLALKNMSHGFNNNVARSHLGRLYRRDGAPSGPNQCNTFIPTAVNQPQIRRKATLHILDGLIGVYEGGPGCWNPTWGIWRNKSLFFATDPVAMDHVGWAIIDARRAQHGWAPVAQMGQLHGSPLLGFSAPLAATLLSSPPAGAATFLADYQNRRLGTVGAEGFDRRQPEHIILAGMIGLGTWDPARIQYKIVNNPV